MNFRLSTGATLALAFSLLTAASLWASYHVSRDLLEAAVREHELDKIQTVSSVVTGLIRQQSEHAAGVAHLVAARNDVAQALGSSSRAELAVSYQALGESFAQAHVDSMELIDAHETVVYRAEDPGRHGDRATGWGVAEALNGQGSVVSDIGPGGVVIRAVEPLHRGAQVVGALSVGLRFDAQAPGWRCCRARARPSSPNPGWCSASMSRPWETPTGRRFRSIGSTTATGAPAPICPCSSSTKALW
jgi:hypothetical protein